MEKPIKETIHAKGFDIGIYTNDFENEFISLTDIAKYKSSNPNDVIKNWMRGRETLEFLGLWESLHNPDFKPVEFDGFRKEAGLNVFTMTAKQWRDKHPGNKCNIRDQAAWIICQDCLVARTNKTR